MQQQLKTNIQPTIHLFSSVYEFASTKSLQYFIRQMNDNQFIICFTNIDAVELNGFFKQSIRFWKWKKKAIEIRHCHSPTQLPKENYVKLEICCYAASILCLKYITRLVWLINSFTSSRRKLANRRMLKWLTE